MTAKERIKKYLPKNQRQLKKIGENKGLMVALIAASFFLGRAEILGGLCPFGPAFAGAASLAFRRKSWLFLAPLLLGQATLGGDMWIYFIITGLIWGGFLFYHDIDGKKQWILLPAVVLAVTTSVRAVAAVFAGPSTYALMLAAFDGIFAAGLSVVLLQTLRLVRSPAPLRPLSTDELVSMFILLLGCVSGLGDTVVGPFNLRDVASRLMILLAAYWGGAGAGAGVGALFGIIPSLSVMASPALVGTYSFSGLLAGAFNGFGRPGVAAGFLLGNTILSLYIVSAGSIRDSILATLMACLLLLLMPPVLMKRGNKLFGQIRLKSEGEERGERLLRMSARRMRSVALLFAGLGEECRDLAEGNNNKMEENLELALSCLSRQVCKDCTCRHICWNVDTENTYRGIMELFAHVEQCGTAYVKDVPENFTKRCPHLKELVSAVNCVYELYCRSNYWELQQTGTRQFLASQLTGTAEVLDGLAREMGSCAYERSMLEMELAKDLRSRGLISDGVNIMSMTEKSLDLWIGFNGCPGHKRCEEGVAGSISALLGKEYGVAECQCAEEGCGRCRFRMLAEGAKTLSVGKAQLAKDGKGICGDCGESVLLKEGKQLLLLSDGMGIGLRASKESSAAINILSRLLEAGFDRETAIETVNNVLMLKGREESFVTLDVCIVDLYSSLAEFIKGGGAPSFVKRGHRVEIIRGDSLPIGMLQTTETESFTKELIDGDLVVMATDGLMDAENKTDLKWLTAVLAGTDISDPQMMAEYLLSKAIDISGGRLRDDITILVAKMEAA